MENKDYVVIHGNRYLASLAVKRHIERLEKEVRRLKIEIKGFKILVDETYGR